MIKDDDGWVVKKNDYKGVERGGGDFSVFFRIPFFLRRLHLHQTSTLQRK